MKKLGNFSNLYFLLVPVILFTGCTEYGALTKMAKESVFAEAIISNDVSSGPESNVTIYFKNLNLSTSSSLSLNVLDASRVRVKGVTLTVSEAVIASGIRLMLTKGNFILNAEAIDGARTMRGERSIIIDSSSASYEIELFEVQGAVAMLNEQPFTLEGIQLSPTEIDGTLTVNANVIGSNNDADAVACRNWTVVPQGNATVSPTNPCDASLRGLGTGDSVACVELTDGKDILVVCNTISAADIRVVVHYAPMVERIFAPSLSDIYSDGILDTRKGTSFDLNATITSNGENICRKTSGVGIIEVESSFDNGKVRLPLNCIGLEAIIPVTAPNAITRNTWRITYTEDYLYNGVTYKLYGNESIIVQVNQ